ncbi:helix-turn-helix domain-containing protein [Ramlibacter sp.]|uniref:XRE family transcriptional regulator n=1 Tax=Ramlibacter sp. TaxID=1917967 RepID=UPI00262A590F|nr:helix-turn-helix domain-containing protein [Ramlibacter sp.]MDB5954068.1 transcriptional regulator [Ramlibacter sp.]
MGSTLSFPLLTAAQLGRMLQSARKGRKLSQAEVGARLGLSQKRVSALELDPGSISVDQMLRWCAAVGLALEIGLNPDSAPSDMDGAAPEQDPGSAKVEW